MHMEAMLDLRNLQAQGYVPVMGQDGRTVYLVQSARSGRGGVRFLVLSRQFSDGARPGGRAFGLG